MLHYGKLLVWRKQIVVVNMIPDLTWFSLPRLRVLVRLDATDSRGLVERRISVPYLLFATLMDLQPGVGPSGVARQTTFGFVALVRVI